MVAALLAALAFGVGGGREGYSDLEFFRGDQPDITRLLASINDDADRANISQAFDHWAVVMDAARARALPLGIATLVIGIALMLFAMRAMAGRGPARSVLLQLIVVNMGLGLVSFALLSDTRAAWQGYYAAVTRASAHAVAMPDNAPDAESIARFYVAVGKWVPGLMLVLQTLSSAAIVLALTRPRSRQFFEAARDPAIEQ